MILGALFNKKINSLTVAAALVALSSLFSRLLGILRDRILAGEFGAGEALDIYYSAFRLPDLIFNLLILGALSAGFIPIFTSLVRDVRIGENLKLFKSDNREAWHLANNILNVLLISLAVLSLIGIFFAPGIVKLISPGFSPEAQAQTAKLTRIMLLSPLFLGISSVLGGILQSFKNFFIYSLSPILYNIGIIFGTLFLYPVMGINGLAWGVVLGAFLHMIIQWPSVCALGFRYRCRLDLKDKNLRRIGKMMIPRTLSLAISQINLLVITIIASSLDSGSLSVFNFANNLQSFPIGIFGISFAVAAFPLLSEAADDRKELAKSFSSTARKILFFIVPATVLLITLRAQIIRVVLGTGSFDWEDTILTMNTLGFFALSLFAQALIPLLVRVFYAQEDSKTPFVIGIFSVLVNIVLSLSFSKLWGVSGLALAFSVSSIFNFVLLWLFLFVRLGDLDQVKILYAVAKFSAAALFAGLMIQVAKILAAPYLNMETFSGVTIQALFAGLVGLVVYIVVCYALKSEELLHFLEMVQKKFPFRKVKVGDQGEARGI